MSNPVLELQVLHESPPPSNGLSVGVGIIMPENGNFYLVIITSILHLHSDKGLLCLTSERRCKFVYPGYLECLHCSLESSQIDLNVLSLSWFCKFHLSIRMFMEERQKREQEVAEERKQREREVEQQRQKMQEQMNVLMKVVREQSEGHSAKGSETIN